MPPWIWFNLINEVDTPTWQGHSPERACVHLLTPKATAWKEIPLRKPQPGPLKWPHT